MSEVDPIEEAGSSEVRSPGELLTEAREKVGLSRLEVSELLGLTQSVIRDIELSRFERFPSGIYARGYLRNYSKLVEVDEEQVLAAYDHYAETHEVPDESPFGTGEIAQSETGNKNKVVIAAVIVVIGLIAALMMFS